jgi:hypothetical protein
MKNKVFWVVTWRKSDSARRFGGTYYLRLQGRRVSQASNFQKHLSLPPVSASCLHGLLFYPEDGGTMFDKRLPDFTVSLIRISTLQSQDRKGNKKVKLSL